MLFLGTTFFSGRHSIDPSLTQIQNINKVSLTNGTFDDLFVSKNPNLPIEGYKKWDYDTVMNPDFDGNFDAGNSEFSLKNTEKLLIKCREVGTFDWITIYVKDVNTVDDFKLHKKDYYRPSCKEYEYMIVAVCNGIENSYITNTVSSEFEGLFVCDNNNIYGTLLDLDYMDTIAETKGQKLDLLNSEYPVIVNNSISNYEIGTASGTFIKLDVETKEIDLRGSLQYRNTMKKWLNNRKPKILKFHDGRIWLISVNGNIADIGDGHNDKRKITFDWIEIGDVNDAETLYNYGLSDVGREWWY